ncbi:MAG: hypothetical protein U0R64_05670 [Candidatus Nanopelagicales bacterium]
MTTIEQWWPQVDAATRQWLTDNNGDDLPVAVAQQITQAGGSATPGVPIPDDEADWIETVANDETPRVE